MGEMVNVGLMISRPKLPIIYEVITFKKELYYFSY